jgi:hypothetical protein
MMRSIEGNECEFPLLDSGSDTRFAVGEPAGSPVCDLEALEP